MRAQREDTSLSEGEADGETREDDEREERAGDEDEEEGDDEQGPEKGGDMDGEGEDEDEVGRASPSSNLALAFETSAPVLGEPFPDSPPLAAAATAPPLLDTASAHPPPRSVPRQVRHEHWGASRRAAVRPPSFRRQVPGPHRQRRGSRPLRRASARRLRPHLRLHRVRDHCRRDVVGTPKTP